MNTSPVDLARPELWSESLKRSQERRRRSGSTPALRAGELFPPSNRDLADADLWVRSQWRARARREAAAARREMPSPSPRGMSLAAVLAVTSGPGIAVAAGAFAPAVAQADTAVKSRGGGVSALQRALGISADGVYGPQTARAVKAYQRNHGMTADGIAGPQTRSALGLGAGPVLKRGGKSAGASAAGSTRTVSARGGSGVAAMQRALGVGADGVFGPQTKAAVKRFQRSKGLGVDGVVGPATRSALGMGAGPVLKPRGAGGGGNAGSGTPGAVAGVIAAANRIATRPYTYGGGHGSFESAGYDCSGSVSYALRGGGLIKAPMASGGLESYGAPGPGKHITIYANAGHAYMTINGRRFDTSARSQTGTRWASDSRSSAGYTVRHPPGL